MSEEDTEGCRLDADGGQLGYFVKLRGASLKIKILEQVVRITDKSLEKLGRLEIRPPACGLNC